MARTKQGGLRPIRRTAILVAAVLSLGVSAALGQHTSVWSIRCNGSRACVLRVARIECESLGIRRECRIARRETARISRVAHAALVARIHVLKPVAPVAAPVDCTTIACDQAYLVQLVGPVEAACAEGVIAVEDPSYNPEQSNLQGSGAYGIPQAMGGMDSAGPDWRTNPRTQERWLVAYARARYGSVCGALAHERAFNWY